MLCLCFKRIHQVDFHTNSAACFCCTKFKQNCECESVWLMHNVLQDFGQSLLFLPGVISSVDNIAFTSWHAITEWIAHSGVGTPSHREGKRRGGKKGPLMKGLNPAPHSHSFPPSVSSLPCGVNLAKRRQHQPIYTSSSSFFLCCAFSFVRRASVSTPHPPLCSLCVCLFAHVCVHGVCVILHALGGGIISSTVRWKTVQPLRLATPASYKLCSWGVMAQVSPPTFTHPHVPPLIAQSVTSSTRLPLLFFVSFHSVFTLIKPFVSAFEQR